MSTMSILGRVCIWILGFYKSENAEVLMGSLTLSFALQIVAKFLCSCHCLFDAIIELHLID